MTSKNRKYAAFDLETGADIPEDDDWQDHRPLGITCAALYAPELGEPITWHGTDETGEIADRMNSGELTLMVRQLEHLQQQRSWSISACSSLWESCSTTVW